MIVNYPLSDVRPETLETMIKRASQHDAGIVVHPDTLHKIRMALFDLPMIYNTTRQFFNGPLVRSDSKAEPDWYGLEYSDDGAHFQL